MGAEEAYRLIPRVKRATLLTLPFVDPEIKNSDIMNYFRMYRNVSKVVHEYYKEAKFNQVKTGRRLVLLSYLKDATLPLSV